MSSYGCSTSQVLQRPVEPSQYTAIRYAERLAEAGALASIGSVGDSYRLRLSKCCCRSGLTLAMTGPAGAFALTCRPLRQWHFRPLVGRAVT